VAKIPLTLFAFIGARSEGCYWWPFINSTRPRILRAEVAELRDKGLDRKPKSYRNVFRWILVGLALTVRFLVWDLWKHILIGVWNALTFVGRFLRNLLKVVHSNKRVLCAIDGTIGGAVSYVLFATPSMTSGEELLVVGFGGVLGAGIGVLHAELVSRRIINTS